MKRVRLSEKDLFLHNMFNSSASPCSWKQAKSHIMYHWQKWKQTQAAHSINYSFFGGHFKPLLYRTAEDVKERGNDIQKRAAGLSWTCDRCNKDWAFVMGRTLYQVSYPGALVNHNFTFTVLMLTVKILHSNTNCWKFRYMPFTPPGPADRYTLTKITEVLSGWLVLMFLSLRTLFGVCWVQALSTNIPKSGGNRNRQTHGCGEGEWFSCWNISKRD